MGPRLKRQQPLKQMKLGDQSRAEFFLTPRNADARDLPLQLDSNGAQNLTELLQHTVGNATATIRSAASSDV